MPKAVEEEIRESVRRAHPDYDEKRVNDEVFAVMNKQGLLHKKGHHKKGRRRHES